MDSNPVYTTNPDMTFVGKSFCLAGKFDGHERVDLEQLVKHKGGIFTPNVSDETDYLVIGSKGTRCCSFSCCKKVVERAIELKKMAHQCSSLKSPIF